MFVEIVNALCKASLNFYFSLLYSAFFRDKRKTVGFLLPMNTSSHSKDSSSLKYSPNQLSTIIE